ncbi:YlxR family protein [Tsukamurella soli]|uniref:YlxR domain-containing protein n=1 Tax=Tsukamurella soli TaxID=644556 RepID=A0ABP8KK64_9ACTN
MTGGEPTEVTGGGPGATSDAPAGPVRTCIGCRRRAAAAALVRTVAVPVSGQASAPGGVTVVVDQRHRLPGRGAWLHPDPECLALARRRGAFRRALRLASGFVDDAVVLPAEGGSGGR